MADVIKSYTAFLQESLSIELANGRLTFDDIKAHAVYMADLRAESPYSASIPEDVFRAYVLSMRVNDEPVTPCAKLLSRKFKRKLNGLSMYDAAVKMNYLCMSYVAYRFNDAKTADVLTILNRGYGRCGEESVFAVLAYRSVGIPARQAYAPLWAHCDDNHGWVEVYVDGAWHFIGACEAEPALDIGWFMGAASRAPLVRAYADAYVEGDAAYGIENNRIAVNITPRYAKCGIAAIRVTRSGAPVPNAKVYICIANDSAIKPIARLVCDVNGMTSIAIGWGTVYAYVYDETDNGFCFHQFCAAQASALIIDMSNKVRDGSYEYVQTIPAGNITPVEGYATKDRIRALHAQILYFIRMCAKSKKEWEYPPPNEISGENTLSLRSAKPLIYGSNIGVERLENGLFRRLDLRDRALGSLRLPDGRYRINTYTRQIDGELSINCSIITLASRCHMELLLSIPDIRLDGMLHSYAMPPPYDMPLAIIVWIDKLNEPARHILNELRAMKDALTQMGIKVEIIKQSNFLLSSIREGLGITDSRLPLSVAILKGNAKFGFSGYNVGTVRMLIQVLEWGIKHNV